MGAGTAASGAASTPMSRSAGCAAALLLLLQPTLAVAQALEGVTCPAGQGLMPGLGCALCGPGTWSNGTSGSCTKCSPGRWSGIIGASEDAVCVSCPPGHWSDEAGAAWPFTCKPCGAGRYGLGTGLSSADACAMCPAGSFSSMQGATSSDTCTRCPGGRYSSQLAATAPASCTPCSAGHWSSLSGASSPFACSLCPAGTWGAQEGASAKSNCTLCPAGKWSGLRGQQFASSCLDCPAGRWSAQEGGSAAAVCIPCAAGKWSSTPGAKDPFACTDCPAGKAQPKPGTPNAGKCLRCPVGYFSSSPGSTECDRCQRGSWTNASASHWCHACPAGRWTRVDGAVFPQRCATCAGGLRCLGGSTAHVEVQFPGFNFSGSLRSNKTAMSAFAARIAAACRVSYQAVVDLYGRNGSVALGEAGRVEAYIVVPTNSSVNAMVDRLYTALFQERMQELAASMFGVLPRTFKVSVQPKVLEPLQLPTVTSTTATTTWTTTTATTTAVASVAGAEGVAEAPAAGRKGLPWWTWLVASVFIVGVAIITYLLLSRKCLCKKVRTLLGGKNKIKRRGPIILEEDQERPQPVAEEQSALLGARPAAVQASTTEGSMPGAWRAVHHLNTAGVPAPLTPIMWLNTPQPPLGGARAQVPGRPGEQAGLLSVTTVAPVQRR